MAGQNDLSGGSGGSGGRGDEVRTHFSTREGVYKLAAVAEYSRPHRAAVAAYNTVQQGSSAVTGAGHGLNPPVRVSFVSLPQSDPSGFRDRICFNYGRELYFYVYKGTKKADLSNPVDKRVYKGTSPTCHDINKLTVSADSMLLLVGFTGGQIQLIDPVRKEVGKLYNEERVIEKTKVTCIKWLPGSPNLFLVSHASGQMYVYGEDVAHCGPTPPTYQLLKQGAGFSVWTCKAKSARNPLYRWTIGDGAIHDFAFSPCSKYLAVVSQDGCLRVLNYDAMELVGLATSYFGGLLCVCWSPDGQLVVAGGEDDLVTVWSFEQRRIVARGQGHRSWITVVAFDPFTTQCPAATPASSSSSLSITAGFMDPSSGGGGASDQNGAEDQQQDSARLAAPAKEVSTCYRLGSVAMDTHLCLWELTDDVLKQPYTCRSRSSVAASAASPSSPAPGIRTLTPSLQTPVTTGGGGGCSNSLASRLANLSFSQDSGGGGGGAAAAGSTNSSKILRRSLNRSDPLRSTYEHHPKDCAKSGGGGAGGSDPLRMIGTPSCPRLEEAPILEPLLCKKVAHERLTALVFREDCVVTACQDGIVCTWTRPNLCRHSANEGTMV